MSKIIRTTEELKSICSQEKTLFNIDLGNGVISDDFSIVLQGKEEVIITNVKSYEEHYEEYINDWFEVQSGNYDIFELVKKYDNEKQSFMIFKKDNLQLETIKEKMIIKS